MLLVQKHLHRTAVLRIFANQAIKICELYVVLSQKSFPGLLENDKEIPLAAGCWTQWTVLAGAGGGGDLDWRILLAQCKNNVSWFINDLYNKMAAEGGECRSQVLTAVLLQGEAD